MRARAALLRLMLQRIAVPSVSASWVAALYVLFRPTQLNSVDGFAAILVFFHCYSLEAIS